jgi:hypothetical protein
LIRKAQVWLWLCFPFSFDFCFYLWWLGEHFVDVHQLVKVVITASGEVRGHKGGQRSCERLEVIREV